MKLVIEVNEEEYKRYKEDKVCSYTSAVLDAVPLNDVLDKIRTEVNEIRHQNLINFVDPVAVVCAVIEIIDKHIGKESE